MRAHVQRAVGEGTERWWPRVEDGPTGVEVRGLLEQRGTDLFLLQLTTGAGAGKWRAVFRASWRPPDHSVQNASKLLSSDVFTTAAPLQQRPCPSQPTQCCYWPKEQESWCCSPVGVFGDKLSQYHSADTWIWDVNDHFLFPKHIYEYCISVYFPS